MARVDTGNRQAYAQFADPLIETLNAARRTEDCQRMIVAFNLTTPEEQPAPLLQGLTRTDSDAFQGLAQQAGLPLLEARRGEKVVKAQFHAPSLPATLTAGLGRNDGCRAHLRPAPQWGVSPRFRGVPGDVGTDFGRAAATIASALGHGHETLPARLPVSQCADRRAKTRQCLAG